MLDEPSIISKVDPKGMISQIESLPEQIEKSKALTKSLAAIDKPKSIMILGMGGSGIAGDVFKDWLFGRIKIPITINKNQAIPRIGSDTLVIAISYSGNTKETLLALNESLKKTDNVVCIASGGKLIELCSKKGLKSVRLPTGYQPRCALGYLFGSLAQIVSNTDVYKGIEELDEVVAHLKGLKVILTLNQTTPNNPAKKFALKLKDYTPIVYVYDGLSSCANRWHTQLNENAKMLAWWGSLPEMNHNEINGFKKQAKKLHIVIIRDKKDHIRIRKRMTITRKIIKQRTGVTELSTSGKDLLTRIFHTVYIGMYASYYLALMNKVDPTPVPVIQELKGMLKGK